MTAVVDELGSSADEPFDPRHDLDVARTDTSILADLKLNACKYLQRSDSADKS